MMKSSQSTAFEESNYHQATPREDALSQEARNTSQLLAWCSGGSNEISVIDIEYKQKYARLTGVQLKNKAGIFDYSIE